MDGKGRGDSNHSAGGEMQFVSIFHWKGISLGRGRWRTCAQRAGSAYGWTRAQTGLIHHSLWQALENKVLVLSFCNLFFITFLKLVLANRPIDNTI